MVLPVRGNFPMPLAPSATDGTSLTPLSCAMYVVDCAGAVGSLLHASMGPVTAIIAASAAAAVFDCLSIVLSNGRVILLETPGKIACQDQGHDSHGGEFFRSPIGEEEGITYD